MTPGHFWENLKKKKKLAEFVLFLFDFHNLLTGLFTGSVSFCVSDVRSLVALWAAPGEASVWPACSLASLGAPLSAGGAEPGVWGPRSSSAVPLKAAFLWLLKKAVNLSASCVLAWAAPCYPPGMGRTPLHPCETRGRDPQVSIRES